MATEVQTISDPPKFSRYKSVRRANESLPAPTAAQALQSEQEGRTLGGLSRYRTVKAAAAPASTYQPRPSIAVPTGNEESVHVFSEPRRDSVKRTPCRYETPITSKAPEITTEVNSTGASNTFSREGKRVPEHLPKAAEAVALDNSGRHHGRQQRTQALGQAQKEGRRAVNIERSNAEPPLRLRDASVQERAQHADTVKQWTQRAMDTSQATPERAHHGKLQKRRGPDARNDHVLSPKQDSVPRTPESSPVREMFGFFKRKRGDENPRAFVDTPRANPIAAKIPPLVHYNRPQVMSLAVGGTVPGIDAPVSAVNAGERRVRIEVNKASIVLPVTPTTTPIDLIRSAANCMSEPVDPRASVLLEYFSKVGVQRPLRKYEHVRDVMNSWDYDMQNSLILVPSATGGHDEDLDVKSVAPQPPRETSHYLYHSQNPGKWNKKWVTLRSDGQVLVARSDSSKDVVNICHMTDYDIYTPTERRKEKKIKPPKKHCFAIKSQQKSSMFESTANYVHFFSTNDRGVAGAWYQVNQRWRSWYLVNVLGEGQRNESEKSEFESLQLRRSDSKSRPTTGQSNASSKDSRHQLGSFRPLLDTDQLQSGGAANEDEVRKTRQTFATTDKHTVQDTKASYTRAMSLRSRDHPPVSFPKSLSKPPNRALTMTHSSRPIFDSEHLRSSTAIKDDHDLTLLGRQPSQAHRFQPNGAANKPYRAESVREPRQSLEMNRSPSVARREKPKPLVDLTPEYREPPQHARKGKGFVPEHVGAGGLVEAATSPEVPHYIPPSTDWRGRNAPTVDERAAPRGEGPTSSTRPATAIATVSRARSMRTTNGASTAARSKTTASSNKHAAADAAEDEAFTHGDTLLANSGPSQGAAVAGRGVVSGNTVDAALRRGGTVNGGRPLVSLSTSSQFVKGSLLHEAGAKDMTAGMHGVAPVDRMKRKSFEVATGEGL